MSGKPKRRAVRKREHQDTGEELRITMPASTVLAVILLVLSAQTSACNEDVTSQILEVSPQAVTIRQGESAAVRVDFQNKSTDVTVSTYSIDLPEDQADIAIDTQICPAGEGSPSCQDWTIRPGLGSVPGEYTIKIGTSADPDTARTVELKLTVVGKELTRTPPAVAVDSAWGVDIEHSNITFVVDDTTYLPGRIGHVLFVTTDGRMWGYGDNGNGAVRVSYVRTDFAGEPDDSLVLDQKDVQPSYIPEIVLVSRGPWKSVLAITEGIPRPLTYSYGLQSDGTLWRWGQRDLSRSPQIGLVQVMPSVSSIAGISAIHPDVGYHVVLVLEKESGNVYCRADAGYAGEDTVFESAPILDTETGNALSSVTSVAAGGPGGGFNRVIGFVLKNGSQPAVIWQSFGELWSADLVELNDVVAMATGDTHLILLRADKTVWSAGQNNAGQLGDGSMTDAALTEHCDSPCTFNAEWTLTAVKATDLDSVTAIAAKRDRSFALRSDGTVWTWGGGILSPVQVQNLDNVRTLGAGYAIKKDCLEGGTLWAIQFPEGSPPTASRVPGVGEDPASRCALAASFDLPPDPVTLDLASSAGSGAFVVLTVSRVGYEGAIDITFEGCPAGVTCAADPIAPGLASTTVSFTSDATGPAAGDYDVTIQATGGGITRTKVITVRIQ